jgi:hypothetical protein
LQNPRDRNLTGDPYFINISKDLNDLHIDFNSICKNAGDSNGININEKDIEGDPRIADGRVDIGADEVYWPKSDMNHNEIVNFFDYATWASYWDTNDVYNINGRLDGDADVDIDDLVQFCDYWLWVPPWSPSYKMNLEGLEEEQSSEMSTIEVPAINDQTTIDEHSNNEMENNDEQTPCETPNTWLVYDGNMMPSYGDEITVYIHSDANLMILDLIADVNGDAEITTAMSEEDCNNFGWDNGWEMNPYIDPSGWVEVSGLSAASFFEGKLVNGTVGYFKFRYYSGQVSVSISTDSWIVDNNIESVCYSTEPLIFGPDPNE